VASGIDAELKANPGKDAAIPKEREQNQ